MRVQLVVELAEGQMRGIDNVVGDIPNGAQLLRLLGYGVLYGAPHLGRERMRAARLLVPLYDDLRLGLHEQYLIAEVHGLELLKSAENILYAVFLAHVGDERDLLVASLRRGA